MHTGEPRPKRGHGKRSSNASISACGTAGRCPGWRFARKQNSTRSKRRYGTKENGTDLGRSSSRRFAPRLHGSTEGLFSFRSSLKCFGERLSTVFLLACSLPWKETSRPSWPLRTSIEIRGLGRNGSQCRCGPTRRCRRREKRAAPERQGRRVTLWSTHLSPASRAFRVRPARASLRADNHPILRSLND